MATLPSKNALNDLAGGYYSYWTDGTTEGRATVAVLLGSADAQAAAETARSSFGLVIGTDVQAYSATLDALIASPLTASTAASTYQPLDADLTAIAALNPSANNLIYKNGSDAWDVATITAFARTLIDDANASTARSTLGLGNVENTALSTWTGSANITTVGALASGSINWSGSIVTTQGIQGSTGTFTGAFHAQTTARIGANTLTADATYDNAVVEGSGGVGLSVLTQTAGGDAGIMLGGPSNTTGAMFRYNQASANTVLGTRIAGHSLLLRADANVTIATLSGALGSENLAVTKDLTMSGGAIILSGTGTGGQGRIYKSSSNGMVLYSVAGSSNDFYFVAASGTASLYQPNGTLNWVFGGLIQAAASTTARASFNVPSGTAPTSPNNGDVWFDGSDFKCRIGGVTKTFTVT